MEQESNPTLYVRKSSYQCQMNNPYSIRCYYLFKYHAVVAVPAYFNDTQRQATKGAGQIAGREVFFKSPTGPLPRHGMDQVDSSVIAVYDLGGGSFDVSILENQKGVFRLETTDDDAQLGGKDFDISLSNIFEGKQEGKRL